MYIRLKLGESWLTTALLTMEVLSDHKEGPTWRVIPSKIVLGQPELSRCSPYPQPMCTFKAAVQAWPRQLAGRKSLDTRHELTETWHFAEFR